MKESKNKPQTPTQRGFENVPARVQRPTAVKPLPPMTPQQMMKHSILGQPVRALIGGHMQVVYLTEYDESSDSYYGFAARSRSTDTADKVPVFTAVSGLRLWQDNSNKDFQFVIPGSDESVLINLAQANAVRAPEVAEVQPEEH